MSLGTSVRHALGPLQRPAIEAYRSVFVDVGELARCVASLGGRSHVLEIGAGDGLVTESLSRLLPDAEFIGIDIGGTPGFMFEGDRSRVTFRTVDAAQLLVETPTRFDLVVLSDVLHHVPAAERKGLVTTAGALVADGGTLVVKESCRRRSLGFALMFAADRYISGDESVSFMSDAELQDLLGEALPEFASVVRTTVPPWCENVVYALTRRD